MEKQNIKKLFWKIGTTVVITLTAVFTVWVYAAFVEPTAGPNSSDQDFAQNILGANNADNDFNSSLVIASSTGSIIERLEYLTEGLFTSECGESTTATQTNCYADDTARYITTDLCNEAKENQCFVPTDNSYYAFGSECSDSTTTAATNCYIDDTAKYVDSGACSAGSNSGYCFMNTATFSAMDSDLTAGNIKTGVTILGVAGTLASAESNPDYPDSFHIAAFVEPSAGPADYDQDFTQNILGVNNEDNDFDSSNVAANNDGSIIERLEYLTDRKASNARFCASECVESTTSTQTNCYADDTARYLTTDLCDEAKENQCFVPTDNSYYAFGAECSDSTTSTQTNCYVDDTARYVDSNVCVNSANTGNCYINTDTFTAMDSDLTAGNIKTGVTIFGVAGTAKGLGTACSAGGECISGFCVNSVCCNNACSGSTCQRCDSYSVSGAGTCGYVSSSAQDPDSECPGAFGTCAATTCSGSGYSCGYLAEGEQGCGACKYCTGSSYTCSNRPLTNWGDNLYSCTGANTRCYVDGTCKTCGGYFSNSECWYYLASGSCDTACSSHGSSVGYRADTGCAATIHYVEEENPSWAPVTLSFCTTTAWNPVPGYYPYSQGQIEAYSACTGTWSSSSSTGFFRRICACYY
ncbi:MAG: hypothetical protein WC619_05135 [Patescibacteria group bacterium]